VVDGQRFDSQREASRWSELRLLERAGTIRNLRRQVTFTLHAGTAEPARAVVGTYVADFTYEERSTSAARGWIDVIEDCKGMRTALYVWKKKHLFAEYGVRIIET